MSVYKLLFIGIAGVGLYGCNYEPVPDCPNPLGSIVELCNPASEQKLDSRGGRLYPALDIAARTKTTIVTGICHSACVAIAMTAKTRYACTNAWYGVHRASTDDGQKDLEEFYMANETVDSAWLVWASSTTPYTDLYVFDAYAAKAVGIVDEIIECED